MRFAKDSADGRICADDAVRGKEYLCPSCGQPVVLKKGKVQLPHFAHFPNKPCIDTWDYCESPWQQQWQRKFPAEQQEVMVSHSAQTHRADIMAGDDVILFQETAIPTKLFNEKNRFFQQDGQRNVYWVIRVEEDIEAGILRFNRRDKNNMFWDHPPVFLKKVDLKQNKKLHILLDMGKGGLKKVEWVAPGSNFERFIIDGSFTPDLTTKDGRKKAAMNQYGRFDAFKAENRPWRRKISSTNSASDVRYHTCDMTGSYHCDRCRTCQHNLITEFHSANKKAGESGGLYFYCKYPEIVQANVIAGDDGKERIQVPSIWLK